MVKTKREFVLATGVISAIALILSITSLSTTQWVNGTGKFVYYDSREINDINYGLFSGTFIQRLGGTFAIPLKVSCLISENLCGYLCKSSQDPQEVLTVLYNNEKVNYTCDSTQLPASTKLNLTPRAVYAARQFINAGLLISTVVFLGLSVIFGCISAMLSIWNTVGNPVEVVFSIYGLYIYNTIASVSVAIALILWGALFATSIANNIGIYYTIDGAMATTEAHLGYSFWLNLFSLVLYGGNVVILFLRESFIRQEPEAKIHITTSEPTDIFNF